MAAEESEDPLAAGAAVSLEMEAIGAATLGRGAIAMGVPAGTAACPRAPGRAGDKPDAAFLLWRFKPELG